MKWWLLLLFILTFSCKQASNGSQSASLYIQPFEDADTSYVFAVAKALQSSTDFKVEVLPARRQLPESFDPERKRFWAEGLLNQLKTLVKGENRYMLGITGTDIAIKKQEGSSWGIMGLAYLNKSVAVISSFRPKRGGAGQVKVEERLILLALHELGHAQGLDHCKNQSCLMHDAEGKMHVDYVKNYCDTCFRYLNQRGFIQKRGIYSQLSENK